MQPSWGLFFFFWRSQARINAEGCVRKGIWRKTFPKLTMRVTRPVNPKSNSTCYTKESVSLGFIHVVDLLSNKHLLETNVYVLVQKIVIICLSRWDLSLNIKCQLTERKMLVNILKSDVLPKTNPENSRFNYMINKNRYLNHLTINI